MRNVSGDLRQSEWREHRRSSFCSVVAGVFYWGCPDCILFSGVGLRLSDIHQFCNKIEPHGFRVEIITAVIILSVVFLLFSFQGILRSAKDVVAQFDDGISHNALGIGVFDFQNSEIHFHRCFACHRREFIGQLIRYQIIVLL